MKTRPDVTGYSLTDVQCSRRSLLALSAAAAAGSILPRGLRAEPPGDVPAGTGEAVKGLEPFDDLMRSFLGQNAVPGAALAITRGGQLIYARGFGLADVEQQEPVAPTALFRIASISKPLTAVALLQLVEQGRVGWDAPVLELLDVAAAGTAADKLDPRWRRITVRHCLQHTGGWDRDASFDPIGRPWQIARALDIEPPVEPIHVLRYMLRQPLDFDPGSRYAYSNLGYLVLGQIIQTASGQPYDSYVQENVLGPLGIQRMRLGRALREHRAEGEVCYYDSRGRRGRALYPPRVGQTVPVQYGAANLEAYQAHGGWIGSAIDLVTFAAAFDRPASCPLLSADTVEQMWARPAGAAGCEADGRPKAAYYGCGWMVRPVGSSGGCNAWHAGRITGSESLLVRRWDGLNWAVLFNTDSRNGTSLAGQIDGRLHQAASDSDFGSAS